MENIIWNPLRPDGIHGNAFPLEHRAPHDSTFPQRLPHTIPSPILYCLPQRYPHLHEHALSTPDSCQENLWHLMCRPLPCGIVDMPVPHPNNKIFVTHHFLRRHEYRPRTGKMDASIEHARKAENVHAFLRFANFYQSFIFCFSVVTRPLTQLTRKNLTFTWPPEAHTSFDTHNPAFTMAPIHMHFDSNKCITVGTNVSYFVSTVIIS